MMVYRQRLTRTIMYVSVHEIPISVVGHSRMVMVKQDAKSLPLVVRYGRGL